MNSEVGYKKKGFYPPTSPLSLRFHDVGETCHHAMRTLKDPYADAHVESNRGLMSTASINFNLESAYSRPIQSSHDCKLSQHLNC